MVAFKILAGGYTSFVATYLFDSTASSLSVISRSQTGENPSWLSLHPTNKSLVYAVNEVYLGALQSFSVNAAGALTGPLDTISSGGGSPAHLLPLSSGEVAIMNYSGGNGRVIPTSSTSSAVFDPSAGVITFPVLPTVQSHPHQALEYRREVFVPDLGGDTIWRLVSNGAAGQYKIQGQIPQPAGSGPRHIAINNDRLFTLHELDSTLSVQRIPTAPNGTASVISSVSIIPSDGPADAKWGAAEILIPGPTSRFPVPYIYVSNRNVGPNPDSRGDSIAIFEHVYPGTSQEGLKLIRQFYTGLSQVRGMQFGPAERNAEEFLIAAGVAGTAGTAVLKRTDQGRNFQVVARNLDIPTRTSFIWL